MLTSQQRQVNLSFSTILKGIVSLFRDPNNLDYVYDFEDGLHDTKATLLAMEFIKSQPRVKSQTFIGTKMGRTLG